MLIRDNAKKTGDCLSFGMICVTCMNLLAFLHSFIFVYSRNLCVIHVVVDKLKQFEPAHDAVSLNSFAVSSTLNTFTSCKCKRLWI
jgi:hypothetical protein